jgi:dethiobiotin synthetase
LRGLFVTGTDTGVGKSVVAAAVCAALAARDQKVAAFKPVVTGLDEEPGEWPRDHELLASVATAGQKPEDVAPFRFGPPVSPHYAAELSYTTVEPRQLIDAARDAGDKADAVVCEGVGGLMVPLTPGYLVRDLAVDLDLPVVIAARPGLGTISHTLLTVEAARAGGLDVAAVVFTPWPDEPDGLERSNWETIESLASVTVCGLRHTTPDDLQQAGESLPLDDMVGEGRGPGAAGSFA